MTFVIIALFAQEFAMTFVIIALFAQEFAENQVIKEYLGLIISIKLGLVFLVMQVLRDEGSITESSFRIKVTKVLKMKTTVIKKANSFHTQDSFEINSVD